MQQDSNGNPRRDGSSWTTRNSGSTIHPKSGRWPVERQILVVVGVSVVVVSLLLYISFMGFEVLSWARAYVAGEAAWSRGQKDAVIALHRYAVTGDPADFSAYQEAIAIPLANSRGRDLLQQRDPDMDAVYQAFEDAGNDREDISGFTAALRAFRNVRYIARAIQAWEHGDRLVLRLEAQAEVLRREVTASSPDAQVIRAVLDDIGKLNSRLTQLERAFTSTLGEGARWLKRVIVAFILASTVFLAFGAVVWSSMMTRRIRRTQDALRHSEEKYRSLVDRATYGMYRSTVDGRFVAVNPALVQMLGYRSEDELLQLSLEHDLYLYPDDRRRLINQYREVDQVEDVEVEWRRGDGRPITVRLSGRPAHRVDGTLDGFEMIVEDVTERKVLEDQLRQSQKMEAVGRLTGGIAHDLNNILTVILANADLLAASSNTERGDGEAESELAELRDAARRGAAMIRKLLAFSRREKLARVPIDLASVVNEASGVLRRLLPESIEIDVSIAESMPMVRADAGAVEQILVNLATNARDAMSGKGRLRIEVLRGRIDEQFAVRRGWGRPGEYVCVRVSDTGSGMDVETRRRVFEPFFTTKAPGSGTGLGMAMIYGLIKQHDGYIDVESRLGVGTTATIYMPVGGVIASEAARQPLLGALQRGEETILVVEDEPSIRSAVQRGLERLGYQVLLSSNGEEGLEVFCLHAADIDLVLTDVVMPKMTGPQMYQALQKVRPDVKVLFMSGYTLRSGSDSAALDPSLPLLRKPWTLGQLASAIRELLDQRARTPVGT